MGKKKNLHASSSSGTKPIDKLNILHNNLVKEVDDLRRQIEDLKSQLSASSADRGILHSIERDVVRIVFSSSIKEAAELNAAKMAAATEKIESAAAQLKEIEMNCAVERDVESIVEERGEFEKQGKKFSPVAVTAIFVASAALIACCFKAS